MIDGVARCIENDGWDDQPRESGGAMKYTGHVVRHTLADGTEVLYDCVQGYSVEDHASMRLRPMTEREAAEVAQIEDDAHADECERDKVASLQQTELW